MVFKNYVFMEYQNQIRGFLKIIIEREKSEYAGLF